VSNCTDPTTPIEPTSTSPLAKIGVASTLMPSRASKGAPCSTASPSRCMVADLEYVPGAVVALRRLLLGNQPSFA